MAGIKTNSNSITAILVEKLNYKKSGFRTAILKLWNLPDDIVFIDAAKGSRNAIAESLSNIIWAPLKDGLGGVSLSANWMWACKNEGEDARLYEAVESCSNFAIELGINIPTGKDSLSMKQKYPDITVAVDKNRCHGIEQLTNNDKKLDVILLDDAFQHRYVKPGINILLVDYHRLIIYDKLHLQGLGFK